MFDKKTPHLGISSLSGHLINPLVSDTLTTVISTHEPDVSSGCSSFGKVSIFTVIWAMYLNSINSIIHK